jgi:hypothetical protein
VWRWCIGRRRAGWRWRRIGTCWDWWYRWWTWWIHWWGWAWRQTRRWARRATIAVLNLVKVRTAAGRGVATINAKHAVISKRPVVTVVKKVAGSACTPSSHGVNPSTFTVVTRAECARTTIGITSLQVGFRACPRIGIAHAIAKGRVEGVGHIGHFLETDTTSTAVVAGMAFHGWWERWVWRHWWWCGRQARRWRAWRRGGYVWQRGK